jgi:hypothetical protein
MWPAMFVLKVHTDALFVDEVFVGGAWSSSWITLVTLTRSAPPIALTERTGACN